MLFGHYEEEFDTGAQVEDTIPSDDAVRERLPDVGLVPFAEVAETLDAVPWDILTVCRRLVRRGARSRGKRETARLLRACMTSVK